jgi:hypothetical protein
VCWFLAGEEFFNKFVVNIAIGCELWQLQGYRQLALDVSPETFRSIMPWNFANAW